MFTIRRGILLILPFLILFSLHNISQAPLLKNSSLTKISINPTPNSNYLDGFLVVEHPKQTEEKLRHCGSQFKKPREVFEDNECYPPIISFQSFVKRTIADAIEREQISLQSFETKHWKSSYYLGWDKGRNENALVKLFESVLVWRENQVTYFKGQNVWSFSVRCFEGEGPVLKEPVQLEQSVNLVNEAILLSSESWVSYSQSTSNIKSLT